MGWEEQGEEEHRRLSMRTEGAPVAPTRSESSGERLVRPSRARLVTARCSRMAQKMEMV